MASLTLIVAATLANGIGQSSRLPWRLPQEMAYFARVTSSAPEGSINAVVMGRNTWESIPPKFRPLARRINIVVSRNESYDLGTSSAKDEAGHPVASTYLHTSLSSAISQVTSHTTGTQGIHRCFIIGGASLYNEVLGLSGRGDPQALAPDSPILNRILLTRILSPAFEECDVFMPEFRTLEDQDGQLVWRQGSHEELQAWVGAEVPGGVQEEKGVRYEFQMWTRSG